MGLEEKLLSQSIYEKHYKKFIAISITIFIFFVLVLFLHYTTTGEIFKKDISLTGGTVLTLPGDYTTQIENVIKKYTDNYVIKNTADPYTGKAISSIIESDINEDTARKVVEELNITEGDYSIESTSSALGKNFFRQLTFSLFLAFIFMAVVVFILFRTFIPSIAVIFAALTDIIGSIALANLFGVRISTAGIAALLMLIGYSVDTDIMLTMRVYKRKESALKDRIYSALKTGLTMSITSLITAALAYFLTTSLVLKEIFAILVFGLVIDIFATWVGNASIITWYMKKKFGE